MYSVRRAAGVTFVTLCLWGATAFGEAVRPQDFTDLQKEVEELRARLAAKKAPVQAASAIGRADQILEGKYGPNAPVTTRDGKLTLGGLVQLWNYSIQNDNIDYIADRQSSNELCDNNGSRIRRAELKFSLDITPEITAVIMVDPTGGDEANTFPGIPSNQTVIGKGYLAGGSSLTLGQLNDFLSGVYRTEALQVLVKPHEPPPPGPNEPPYFIDDLSPGLVAPATEEDFHSELAWLSSSGSSDSDMTSAGFVGRRNMQSGFVQPNRFLQDAYINYCTPNIPHHDFTVGQFKPPMGEEGNRNSGQLDFVERAMINQFSNQRDLGIMVHGWWWEERLQYWIGAFNTAGTFHNTFCSLQNRSDDNDPKDLAWKILLRPLWRDERWGSLEFGYSRQDGVHGEGGDGYILDVTTGRYVPRVDGLSLQETHANRQYAWAWYRPGGPVRGWWLRGEWATLNDRPLPGFGATNLIQLSPRPYKRDGWYFATGYRLSDSVWADQLKSSEHWLIKMLHDVEFAYRYEVFGNLLVEDAAYQKVEQTDLGDLVLVSRSAVRTDVFNTDVHTFGVNYYWKGYNVRTQINYMLVDESEGHAVCPDYSAGPNGKRIREVRNNVFIVSHQVQW